MRSLTPGRKLWDGMTEREILRTLAQTVKKTSVEQQVGGVDFEYL